MYSIKRCCIFFETEYNESVYIFSMSIPTHEQSEVDSSEEHHESKTPEIAQKKVSRFGPGQFQNGSKFGKNTTHFNPPNKQRIGRSAGRGR